MIIDPATIAQKYINEVCKEITRKELNINILGLIATKDKPSISYAKATQKRFADVGINYDLQRVERLDLEKVIDEANKNPAIHGIFIYFPVFNNQQDDYLRNQVGYHKDIEAGSIYWTRKLYTNDRLAGSDSINKALLPCTPLAVVKLLTEIGRYTGHYKPLENKKVTIFNRSEVIGRPLAVMMSNDGAEVYSFDVNGPLLFENARPHETNITRAEALKESQIVITGVPNSDFALIKSEEISDGTICVNFSSLNNFADDITTKADIFVPRIGPMTVAMCMRNTLRIYQNYQEQTSV